MQTGRTAASRLFNLSRQFSTSQMLPSSEYSTSYAGLSSLQSTQTRKVTILGAAGGIGQPLSLLLKAFPYSNNKTPLLSHLALYDIVNMGMSADLAHISTPVKVTGHSGAEQLPDALQDADIVLIPAGVPRKPGMTRDDLFNINAGIVRDLSIACAKHCPHAHLLVISNPVNATVPIAYETLRKHGVMNPSVFGVTTLDIVRAQTFVAEELQNQEPENIDIHVIGGHSGATIIPLISHIVPQDKWADIIHRIQYGGDEVVKAKAGGGSATLSMAYAAYRFFVQFMNGLINGHQVITAYLKIPNGSVPPYPTEYFSTRIVIGTKGLNEVTTLSTNTFNSKEQEMLQTAVAELERDIAKGKAFAST